MHESFKRQPADDEVPTASSPTAFQQDTLNITASSVLGHGAAREERAGAATAPGSAVGDADGDFGEDVGDDVDGGAGSWLLAGLDEGTLAGIPPALLQRLQQLEEERDELAGRLLESDAELCALRASYSQLSQSHASSQTWLNQVLAQQMELQERRQRRGTRQTLSSAGGGGASPAHTSRVRQAVGEQAQEPPSADVTGEVDFVESAEAEVEAGRERLLLGRSTAASPERVFETGPRGLSLGREPPPLQPRLEAVARTCAAAVAVDVEAVEGVADGSCQAARRCLVATCQDRVAAGQPHERCSSSLGVKAGSDAVCGGAEAPDESRTAQPGTSASPDAAGSKRGAGNGLRAPPADSGIRRGISTAGEGGSCSRAAPADVTGDAANDTMRPQHDRSDAHVPAGEAADTPRPSKPGASEKVVPRAKAKQGSSALHLAAVLLLLALLFGAGCVCLLRPMGLMVSRPEASNSTGGRPQGHGLPLVQIVPSAPGLGDNADRDQPFLDNADGSGGAAADLTQPVAAEGHIADGSGAPGITTASAAMESPSCASAPPLPGGTDLSAATVASCKWAVLGASASSPVTVGITGDAAHAQGLATHADTYEGSQANGVAVDGAVEAAAMGAGTWGMLVNGPSVAPRRHSACAALHNLSLALSCTDPLALQLAADRPSRTRGGGRGNIGGGGGGRSAFVFEEAAEAAAEVSALEPRAYAVRGAMEELEARWRRLVRTLQRMAAHAGEGGGGLQGGDGDMHEAAASKVLAGWAVRQWLPQLQRLVLGVAGDDELPEAILAAHRAAVLTARLCSETGHDPANITGPMLERLEGSLADMAAITAVHVAVTEGGGAAAVEVKLGDAARCLDWQATRVEADAELAECKRRCSPRGRLAAALRSLGVPRQLVEAALPLDALQHDSAAAVADPGASGFDAGAWLSGTPHLRAWLEAALLAEGRAQRAWRPLLRAAGEAAAKAGRAARAATAASEAGLNAAEAAAATTATAATEAVMAAAEAVPTGGDWWRAREELATEVQQLSEQVRQRWRQAPSGVRQRSVPGVPPALEEAVQALLGAARRAYREQYQALRCECTSPAAAAAAVGAGAGAAVPTAERFHVNGTVGPSCVPGLTTLLGEPQRVATFASVAAATADAAAEEVGAKAGRQAADGSGAVCVARALAGAVRRFRADVLQLAGAVRRVRELCLVAVEGAAAYQRSRQEAGAA